ncbi:MAG: hypothetical protein ACR2FV_05375 [Ornithinimicrobium sp.]|uniref:hypothetical protein n=1 Tax=Ornithinimicrobium sp. TaxID=1977084 RepID=UPI003D9AC734
MAQRAFPEIPGQRGLATRAQLIEAGWTVSGIRHAVQTTWQQPLPRVFASHRGELDTDTLVVAAALWAGPTAVLTAGAALHVFGGLDSPPRVATFVVSASSRSSVAPRAQRMRSVVPAAVAHRRGVVTVVSPARALVDSARWDGLETDEVQALTISCLQRSVTNPPLLKVALAAAGRRGQAGTARGLAAFTAGAWSLPEATLHRLMRESPGLPSFVLNHALHTPDGRRIGIPDAYLPSVGIAVQVHSRAHHSGIDEVGHDLWSRTVEHDNAFAAHGVLVLGVTPQTLTRAPEGFVRQLLAALEARRDLPTPAVVLRCPDGCDTAVAEACTSSHSS